MNVTTSGCTHIGGKEVNQDSFFHTIRPDGSAYLGVFDGHCQYGGEVSKAVCNHFKETDMEKGFANADNVAKQALLTAAGKEAYERRVDRIVYKQNMLGYPRIVRGGTTASVVEIKDNCVRVGHVGDSEVMIIHESGEFIVLTNDHSSNSLTEWIRIQKEADIVPKVLFTSLPVERSVFVKIGYTWKVNPIGGAKWCNIRGDWASYLHGHEEALNMTRSIGDFSLKKHGVSSKPDSIDHHLPPGRSIVLIASDGLYDSFKYEELRDLVLKGIKDSMGDVEKAAKYILDDGVENGFTFFGQHQDNTTVVLAIIDVPPKILDSTEEFLAKTATRRRQKN